MAGGPGPVPAAGLFCTICLAWSKAAALAGQMEAAPAALLLFMVAGRKNNGAKQKDKKQPRCNITMCSPVAEHRSRSPAPSASPGPTTSGIWGLGGLRRGRGSPRSHGQGDGGRGDMQGCAGLREVRAGCPAQPHIPEGWKRARGQGLGWGGCSQTLLLITPRPRWGILCEPPVPRVPHAPAPGTRSTLVPKGPQPDPHPARVQWSIIRYQNNPPGPSRLPGDAERADCTAECPGLPAGMPLSLILIIVSRNHRHAAPHDPRRLQSGVPRGDPVLNPQAAG